MPIYCVFHPTVVADVIDPHSHEPVCRACVGYRTCPVCQTIQPFGAYLDSNGQLECLGCLHVWTPREPPSEGLASLEESLMHKRNYIALAEALAHTLAAHPGPKAQSVVFTATQAVADVCQRDNAAFNRDTFFRAVFGQPEHTASGRKTS